MMSISKNNPYKKKEKLTGRTTKSALQSYESFIAGYKQYKAEKAQAEAKATK
jgi:hypothetical protein